MNNNKVVLVVLDGVGYSKNEEYNAVKKADFNLQQGNLNTYINASGKWVGLNEGEMGNSEVGHNTMGAGKIYKQGSALLNDSFESGEIFLSPVWKKLCDNVKENNSTFHFLGLLSDGRVHSNIEHLKQMLLKLHEENIKNVRIHILLDGRDVEPQSALKYIYEIEEYISKLNENNYLIASGGGRMQIIMDRYNANYDMVKNGFDVIVNGIGKQFDSAENAVKFYRECNPNLIDQDIPSFVISKNGEPIGKIKDGDSLLNFNFRADRAVEISRVFNGEYKEFGIERIPNICYAGMLEYDSDNHIPKNYLIMPPKIEDCLEEYLVKENKKIFAVSETQKFGHITKYFNGNHVDKFNNELETFVEIPSDNISFDLKPEMKACEIKEEIIKAIKSQKYDFIRCNFANGDMVGHTGNFNACVEAMKVLKYCLNNIIDVCKIYEYNLIVFADHGNSEEMATKNKNGEWIAKTSHTTNVVPLMIFTNKKFKIDNREYGLSNIAKTVTDLMDLDGLNVWDKSIISAK